MKPSYSPPVRLVAGLLMAGTALLAGGCAKKDAGASSAASSPPVEALPGETRYPLTGEIIAANPDRKTLTVTHDEIKGFMMGMTMEFKVSKGDLENARPGQRIRAELVKRGDDYRWKKSGPTMLRRPARWPPRPMP